MNSVELAHGTVRYRDEGEGRPVVFVHGILVNGLLWRRVTPRLDGVRRIVPDWPLGSHEVPMRPDADLTPPGLARMIADFLDALGLDDVVLVGNDTGGALAQIAAANHPERIGALALTPCDAFENFLPPLFRGLQVAARVPGALTAFLAPLRIRPARRLPLAFGWLRKHPIEDAVSDAYLRPYFEHAGVRRDLQKVLRGISSRHTLDAAARLASFGKPARVVWATEDRVFPLDHGRRLAEILSAPLVEVPDSYSFVPEDQPDRLAAELRELAAG
ncbi:MAG TPA: alpha/beta hydrolase [Solirubrobacteraceae bacterium]|jgi:pimeloyl-ACP methyl ester carboxylesterase|nr:alpha/beta hydrolase [Solirubrobacteraceae bacterium]